MSTAWIYAGQGSQTPGMGRDIYDAYPETRDIFESGAAGFDLRELCFSADAVTLSQTRFTQPCMAAFAAAVTRILKNRGFTPDYAAGLSLGEYSALHAAGVFDAETLLSLLAFRGIEMEKAALHVRSRMSAVLGLTEELVGEAVAIASESGVVTCTNFNCPGQIVIGGEEEAVLLAERLCIERGAGRVLALKTSGPFHTPFMAPASEALRKRFAVTAFAPQNTPVVFNVTGETADNGEIPELLALQVKMPVQFEKTIRNLLELGVREIVEIGPGHALSAFVRKTAPEINVFSIESVGDIEKFTGREALP